MRRLSAALANFCIASTEISEWLFGGLKTLERQQAGSRP